MTSLEDFLKKQDRKENIVMEPAHGTFSCQDSDCEEIVYDGYIDRTNNRLHWICSKNHDSSVVI